MREGTYLKGVRNSVSMFFIMLKGSQVAYIHHKNSMQELAAQIIQFKISKI